MVQTLHETGRVRCHKHLSDHGPFHIRCALIDAGVEPVPRWPQNLLCGYCWEETWGLRLDVGRGSDMLDLDKAWRHLQWMTAPRGDRPARPAHRMFEGQPSWGEGGGRSWVRTLIPDEVPGIARDLAVMGDREVAVGLDAVPFADPDGSDVPYRTSVSSRRRLSASQQILSEGVTGRRSVAATGAMPSAAIRSSTSCVRVAST